VKISLNIITLLPGDLLAVPLIDSAALLLSSVLGVLPWNLVALLFRGVLGNTSVLSSAILSVLNIALLAGNRVALLPRNLLAVLPWDLIAHLLGGIISVRNRLGSTILSGNLLAVLFWNLLTLLPGFIPTLLFAIDISTLPFGYGITGLFIPS